MQYPGNKIRNHNKQHRYTIEFVLATIHKGFYDQFFSFLEIASQRKQPIFRSIAPQNAFWETSAEIPYRWGSASDWPTQIFNQSEALPSDTSSVWNFCARSSDVILRGDQWGRHNVVVVSLLRLRNWNYPTRRKDIWTKEKNTYDSNVSLFRDRIENLISLTNIASKLGWSLK